MKFNLATLALGGALVMVALVVFDKVSIGKGLLIGGGLLAAGFALQPETGSGITS